MDFVNLPVFNPNVFSEDEDDLPGVFTHVSCLSRAHTLSQWVVLGDRVVVVEDYSTSGCACRLSKVGRHVRCHGRKVTYCHWFGEEESYQSKDD